MNDLEFERKFLFYVGIKALIKHKSKVLLLSSGREELSSTMRRDIFWDLPGGKIEAGEQVEEALRREISEELGIGQDLNVKDLFDVSTSNFKVSHDQRIPLILVTYLCELKDSERKFELTDEHAGYEWVDVKTAAERLSAKFNKSFVEKVLEFL